MAGPQQADDRPGQQVLIGKQGQVVREEGQANAQFDHLVGFVWQLMIQPLPQPGQTTWNTQKQVVTYSQSGGDNRDNRFPFGRPMSPFDRRDQGVRVERAANETVTYTLGAASDGKQTIHRVYNLATEIKVGDKPATQLRGEGDYTFDTAAGVVSSFDSTYTYEVNQENLSGRIPIEIHARLLKGEELEKLKKRAEVAATEQAARQKEFEERVRKDRANREALPDTIKKTATMGTEPGGGDFKRIDADSRPVLGLHISIGSWGGKNMLRDVDPLYEKPEKSPDPAKFKNKVGDQIDVLAKEGYALGGVFLSGPDQARAIRLIFMKKTANGLDPKVAYVSPWYGELVGQQRVRLGGNGKFVAGTFGRKGLNMNELGLLMFDDNAAAKAGEAKDPTDDPNFAGTPAKP